MLEGNYDSLHGNSNDASVDHAQIKRDIDAMIADETKPQIWRNVVQDLRKNMKDANIKSWILPLEPEALQAPTVNFTCSSRFIRDYVREHYGGFLLAAFKTQDPGIEGMEVRVV